jgi:hypothetical protein
MSDLRINIGEMGEPQRKRHGCFFYGCITMLVVFVIVIVGLTASVWWLQKSVSNWLFDTKPLEFANASAYSPEVAQQAQTKIAAFDQKLKTTTEAATLAITDTEINAILANNAELKKSGIKIEVQFSEKLATGRISIPWDQIVKMLRESNSSTGTTQPIKQITGWKLDTFFPRKNRDRYINGAMTIDISTRNGQPDVHLKSFEIHNKPLPEFIMREIRKVNFAENSQRNPENAEALRQIQSITLQKGQISIAAVGGATSQS